MSKQSGITNAGASCRGPCEPEAAIAYTDEAVQRIRFVKRAQELGFSLKEIQELLGLCVTPGITSTDIRKRAEMKICHIDRKIQDLKTMRKNFAQLINACPACAPASECPILEDLNGRRNS